MKISKQIKPELLLEELESLGTVFTVMVDGEPQRMTRVNLTKKEDGYELTGVDNAEPVIEAHDPIKTATGEQERNQKRSARDLLLKRLKMTEQELKDLLDVHG